MIKKTKEFVANSRLYYFTKDVMANPLFSGSAIMIVGSNASNLVAYIYHFIFGRILGPESYGELAATITLIGMLGAMYGFLGTVIVKFVSASPDEDLPGIFRWFRKKTYVASLIVGIVLLIITPFIARFLHLDQKVVVLISPVIAISLISYIYRAFLQGLMKFLPLVLSSFSEMLGRLLIGFMFVSLGGGVFGAMFGLLLAVVIGFVIALKPLSAVRKSKEVLPFSQGRKVVLFAIPILVSSVAIFSFVSTDLLLVKHFFTPVEAGLYASLATLSKIIFYGTAPVASVMFPLVSKKHARGENYQKVFLLSVLLTLMIGGFVLAIYSLFPHFALRSLYGDTFITAAGDLPLFGLFMSIFTLASLFCNYYLSQEKTWVAYVIAFAAGMQALGIWLFHNSITQVITISVISASLLLGVLLLYFIYDTWFSKR